MWKPILVAHLLWSLVAWPAAGVAAAPSQSSKKEAIQNRFLVFGTVFTDQGFAFYGAQVKVRQAGDRKVRWEARSDHRGEFAVRVPKGAEYEITVSARGWQEVTRKVDARTGDREDLVFRLQLARGDKK